MGIFARNGKLLTDGARLRGCCCDAWKLTAFAWYFEGEHGYCTYNIKPPEQGVCISGSIEQVYDAVNRTTEITVDRACVQPGWTSGCTILPGEVKYPFFAWPPVVHGNVAEAEASFPVTDVETCNPSGIVLKYGEYHFNYTLERCAA